MNHEKRKVRTSTFFGTLLALAGIYILGTGAAIYLFGASNWVFRATARNIPYPAAAVGTFHFVTLSELEKNLQSVRRFYENQDFSEIGARVDFSTPDGQKRLMVKKRDLLNKMIENKIIEMLAREQGIAISDDMVLQEVDRKMEEYGSRKEVEERLGRLYGWELEDFQEKIVKPDLYKERLERRAKEENNENARAKDKIEQVLSELENGGDFSEAAARYSQGESAKNGGELGWFSADQMIPPIAAAAFSMEKGSRSGIIESALGYHIIQVEDKKTEDGAEKIKIKQILARTENFSDWLARKEKEIAVYIPLKEFYWNKESSMVEFQDFALREFFEQLDQNSEGDISVLF